MGISASNKFCDVIDAIDYLDSLQTVKNSNNLGYRSNTNNRNVGGQINRKKRKREEILSGDVNLYNNEKKMSLRKKRRIIPSDNEEGIERKSNSKWNYMEYQQILTSNDYDEELAINKAIKESQ